MITQQKKNIYMILKVN